MSATPHTQVCCCKGSQCVGGNTTWIILPQSVPKFLCGTHTGFYFFFKKKSYSCEKSSKWRNQPSRQVITAYSQKCPLETQDARGCEAYIASAVFLPVLPTDISASHLSPIYLFILCLQEYLSWWQALLPTKLKLKQNQRFSYNK